MIKHPKYDFNWSCFVGSHPTTSKHARYVFVTRETVNNNHPTSQTSQSFRSMDLLIASNDQTQTSASRLLMELSFKRQ